MPTLLSSAPAHLPPEPKKWTRQELKAFIDAGFIDLEHYELWDGNLYNKMGKKWKHVNIVSDVVSWLISLFPGHVAQEAPINLRFVDNPTYRPEPDAILLRVNKRVFQDREPDPSDILLLIEVADTTLSFDLQEKAPKHAEAGIPELWVLDLNGRRMIVHRDPAPSGYQSILVYAEDEQVSPQAAPTHSITVGELLDGPAEKQ